MKGCLGVLVLLLTFPLALLGACAGGGGGAGVLVLLCGVGLSIYLFIEANADSNDDSAEIARRRTWLAEIAPRAEAGDIDSLFECAYFLETSPVGNFRDYPRAKEYYLLAAKLGHEPSKERLSKAEKHRWDVLFRIVPRNEV